MERERIVLCLDCGNYNFTLQRYWNALAAEPTCCRISRPHVKRPLTERALWLNATHVFAFGFRSLFAKYQ